MNNLEIFIVTGMSGSGKSVVLRILEDAGFFCVDNLPIQLLDSLLTLLSKQNRNRIAIAIDARDKKSLESLVPKINLLQAPQILMIWMMRQKNILLSLKLKKMSN